MKRIWNETGHLRTFSLLSATMIGLIAREWRLSLLSLSISVFMQIAHARKEHTDQLFAGTLVAAIATVVAYFVFPSFVRFAAAHAEAVTDIILGVSMYDAALHHRQHMKEKDWRVSCCVGMVFMFVGSILWTR